MANKMQWLIDKFNENKMEYLISDSNDKKGTIVAPTGAGKSGIMFSDTIHEILTTTDGEKKIFHYATPILKLGVQTINDLVSVISIIFKDRCDKGEFMFFINSSADGRDYSIESLNADTNHYSDIRKFGQSEAKFAIVISCFDSIYKFANDIDYFNSFAKVTSYIDEAHLIVNQTRDDISFDKLNEDGKAKADALENLCRGNRLFALTATPDKYVTEAINKANGTDASHLSINIRPNDLINTNIILPIETYTCKVTNDSEAIKITPEHCITFMDFVKDENPNIPHKVLVTCANTDHLILLRDELSKYYKVFSTCSKEGASMSDEDELKDIDEVKFINEVDSFNRDCFVLHIKQLRQGIDIKTLTDCIFYNSTRVNDGVKRTIIQTIGRCLRPMLGERGMNINERKKKVGRVLFLIGEKDYDGVMREMTHFLIKYYGLDGITCFTHDINKKTGVGKGHGSFSCGKFGDGYFNQYDAEVDELRIKMDEYIKTHIKPKHDIFVRLGGGKPNPKLIPMAIAEIKHQFALYNGEHNTMEIISDRDFMNAVMDAFAKYGVE